MDLDADGRTTWHTDQSDGSLQTSEECGDIGHSYNQQLRYWRDDKGIFKCPIVLFDKHLEEELKTWLLAGENIAVAMDVNEDIRTGKISVIMRRLGLRNVLLQDLFPYLDPQETCIKNRQQNAH